VTNDELLQKVHIDTEVLKREIELRFDASKTALDMQATEYARRLDALNGEAERLRIMQASYVPREAYDIAHMELIKKVEDLQVFKERSLGRQSIISVGISAAISLIVSGLIVIFGK
jgi:uncharacterized secreted protein with C-terminal beta-propeller domain